MIFKSIICNLFAEHEIKLTASENSFMINTNKIGGILEEHFCEGTTVKYMAIGIGLYTNSSSDKVKSIKEITNKSLNNWEILSDFLRMFFNTSEKFN